jgi:hypothetical protein
MIDWQPLLDGRVKGFDAPVGGARVGDGVDALPFEELTQVRPRISQREGEDVDLGGDGQRGAVTRESPLSELRKSGGHAYAGPVTYEVAKGQIRKIWVRGGVLSTLPFKAEADIERLLGPSSGVERTLGWVVYHYPERGLSVGWHAKEGRIEHVSFGPVDWVPPIFGAKEVLQEWLLAAKSGLEPEWQEPQERNSSQWARHARVTALLRAFELGTPKDFKEGRFLQDKPLSAYPHAMEALQEVPEGLRGREAPDALGRLFWWLLVYRTEAEGLLKLNSGWLAAGHPGILAALRMTGDANDGVAAALEDVDALLVELIDPTGKQVTEREMIERWDWPQVDLDDLLRSEL